MLTPTTPAPQQCVILIGGLGSRLGALTANCPKPLLSVGGRPFLDELLWQAKRFGFRRILLLAGYRAENVAEYASHRLPDPILSIEVVAEPEQLGTGGALRFAAEMLEDRFYLLNGDSLFDFNWLDLALLHAQHPPAIAAIALRREADASRFGTVKIENDRIMGFRDRGDNQGGLINAGVYCLSRDIVPVLPEKGSLERDVFPALAVRRQLRGRSYDGFFIDIGIPATYAAAGDLIARNRTKPALFLDRDGVLNVDHDYIFRPSDLEWVPGAIDAVKLANDSGHYVFIVTNQAGIVRGIYAEDTIQVLHEYMQGILRAHGAHIDNIRYCPLHPGGLVPLHARPSDRRQPAPGTIFDILKHWSIDSSKSLFIGSKPHSVRAAKAAGIRGKLFEGGSLREFFAPLLS